MCVVLLPPGVNPIAINKYIYIYIYCIKYLRHDVTERNNIQTAKWTTIIFLAVVKWMDNITYLLTPRCRDLLEQLTGLQLVKKFPAFHRTRRFITALTSVRHLSLSCASPIQSIYPHPTSWRSILILSTHLCLGLLSTTYNFWTREKSVHNLMKDIWV